MEQIEPLSKAEQDIVIEAAKLLGDLQIHGKSINPHALVLFFLETGAHPCVLAEKVERDLKVTEEDGKKFISWKRPKKKGAAAFTMLPVSVRLLPIIEAFLSLDLPNYRKYYNDVLAVVRSNISSSHPGPWTRNICPLGFRHSFGVNRIEDGFPETKVQQLMNCSAKTLQTYIRYSKKRLTEKGW